MSGKVIVGALGIVKKDDKVLVALRYDPVHPELHHKWEFPGGEMDYDELPPQTVKREVEEEVGIKVGVGKLVPFPLVRFFGEKGKQAKVIFFAYYCHLISGDPKPSNQEIAQVKWVEVDDINPKECTPFTRDLLQNVLQSK